MLDRYLWISMAITAVMAIPLLLYVMVNAGIIPEIKTAFFSVPRGSVFRAHELSFRIKDLYQSFVSLVRLLIFQSDGLIWNAAPHYGLYYRFSLVFAVPGMIYSMHSIKQQGKAYSMELIIWIWLILAVVRGCLSEVNINQINMIHIPVIFFIARGCDGLIRRFRTKMLAGIIGIYTISFGMFTTYYFTDYNESMYRTWFGGFQEALDQAMQYEGAMVHMADIIYPNALLQMEVPPSKPEEDKYRQDGEFRFECAVESEFEGFEYNPEDVYICGDDNEWMADFFERNGMETQQYGTFILGYTPD